MAEPLNATFFAFRKREQSGVLLRASIAFVIAMLVLYGGFIAAFWAQLQPFFAWYIQVISAAGTGDTAAISTGALPASLGMLILGGFVWLFLLCVIYAAYEAACLRWMIHGETSGGFMGLTLGANTWRVYAGYWVWFFLYLGFSIAMMIVMGGVLGALAVNSGEPNAMFMALPIIYLLQYGLMIYFGVRLAPAAATSIARGKFAFFDAWKVTKGRFWSLFGAFLLLALIYMLFCAVYFSVWFAAVLGPLLPDWSGAWADPQRFMAAYTQTMTAYMQSFMQPSTMALVIALQAVGSIVGLLIYVAYFGVNARAAQAALEEGKISAAV